MLFLSQNDPFSPTRRDRQFVIVD